ncbi:MAG TPA: hypothetical protein VF458_06860 [Ktedonobacteraceae bacterium]
MSQPFTPPTATSNVGKVALFFGLRAGLLLGIAQTIFIIYNHYGSGDLFSLFTTPLSVLLWVGAFLGAGYLTARQIGKTSAGTLAGLWAGAIGGVFTAGALLIEFIYTYGFSDMEWLLSIIATMLTSLIFFVIFTMVAGTGLGALGGLIGQSFFNRTSTPPFARYQPPATSQQHEPPQQQTK